MKSLLLLFICLNVFCQEYNFTAVNNITNVRCGVLISPKYIGCEIKISDIDDDELDEAKGLILAWVQIKTELDKRGLTGRLVKVGFDIGWQGQSSSSSFSSLSKSGSTEVIERKNMVIIDIPKEGGVDNLLKIIPEIVKGLKFKKFKVFVGVSTLGVDDISIYRNEIVDKIKADLSEIETSLGSKGLVIKGLEENPVLKVSGEKLKVILPVTIEILK